MSDEHLVCSFRLAEHEFAVEIDRVQEVLRHQEIVALREEIRNVAEEIRRHHAGVSSGDKAE